MNAVSLYIEHKGVTFRSVHVEAAGRIASVAHRSGVERLVHVSGIGANAASSSSYIRSRGEGERAVRLQFPNSILIRPAVMFGSGDAFLTAIVKLLRRLPAYPMFGRGHTRLQPAYVEDVAKAVATVLQRADTSGATFECAGPHVYSYRELLTTIASIAGVRAALIPVPFAVWRALARIAEILPHPPLTRNQVELMEIDSVAGSDAPGFDHSRHRRARHRNDTTGHARNTRWSEKFSIKCSTGRSSDESEPPKDKRQAGIQSKQGPVGGLGRRSVCFRSSRLISQAVASCRAHRTPDLPATISHTARQSAQLWLTQPLGLGPRS